MLRTFMVVTGAISSAAAWLTTTAAATDVVIASANRHISTSALTASDAGCFDQSEDNRQASGEGSFDEVLLHIAQCGSPPLAEATSLAQQNSIVSATFLQAVGGVDTTAHAPCWEDPCTQQVVSSSADAVASAVYSVHFTVLAPTEITWVVTLEASGGGDVLFEIDGTDGTIVSLNGAAAATHRGTAVLAPDEYCLTIDAESLVFASDCVIGLSGEASFDAVVTIKTPDACPGDVDGDGVTGFLDLLALLTAWGPCDGCREDIDEDGTVGFNDLLIVLTGWGGCG